MARRITAAFVPLVDSAALVAARECGFAAQHGIDLQLVREPSWSALRDHLNLRHVDCAHALAPLPIASTLGVGHVRVDCIVPLVLGRGGNAITLSNALFDELCAATGGHIARTPVAAGRALARVIRSRNKALTLGMVFPFSNHNFELRYWLAAQSIDPDRDVRLVAIPPPLMVESLRAGQIDGFCVGEPWNSLAVDAGIGRIVATKSQLMPRAIEKVLAFRADLGDETDALGPVLRALYAAAAWADDPVNHDALAKLLSRSEYLGVPAELIRPVLDGSLPLGGGEQADDPDFVYFHRYGANLPQPEEALWIYSQMVRWGQLAISEAGRRLARGVFRPDLCRRHIDGLPEPEPMSVPFDGVEFRAAELDSYLAEFPVAARAISPLPLEG